VDFRLIAATNRNLDEMVPKREFRSDLYYRLNVFPIRIPPLRERPEDIPPLVRYFVQRFAKRLRRPIESLSRESMELLCRWPWPGNVRELQNVIERAVILSHGTTLTVSRAEFESPMGPTAPSGTLEEAEREHILRTLEQTGWVIGGPQGAAPAWASSAPPCSRRCGALVSRGPNLNATAATPEPADPSLRPGQTDSTPGQYRIHLQRSEQRVLELEQERESVDDIHVRARALEMVTRSHHLLLRRVSSERG